MQARLSLQPQCVALALACEACERVGAASGVRVVSWMAVSDSRAWRGQGHACDHRQRWAARGSAAVSAMLTPPRSTAVDNTTSGWVCTQPAAERDMTSDTASPRGDHVTVTAAGNTSCHMGADERERERE